MTPLLVYSPDYDISLPGLGWLHPFDGKKFSRAWARLLAESAGECEKHWLRPDVPVAEAELLRVHSRDYLRSLSSAAVVAKALEIRAASFLPGGLIERRILTPMRMAVAGTLLATRHALRHDALVMNIGGGFHHAFRDRGEGFCIYADVAAAIATVRAEGLLTDSDPIAIIDLDAHRGNGVWDLCGADPAVRVFDVYNFQVYPGLFPGSIDDFPFQIPVKARTTDDAYLGIVREELPVFLDSMARPRLAIYNAGTDILAGDPVGHLAVSAEGVVARDDAVLRALLERKIPTVIVTSGGYAAQSHELIAKLALRVLRNDRMGTLR